MDLKGTRKQNRRNPGVKGRRPDRKKARIEGAVSRLEARARRTPRDQASVLDKLLGSGVGAKRERARLLAGK